jgi:flavorubredoxin
MRGVVFVDKILVVYGRGSGWTGQVGLAVGEQLSRSGFQVQVRPCSRAPEPSDYRAVVVGSAAHGGCWERSVLDYVEQHASVLGERATWLYQVAEARRSTWPGEAAAELLSRVADEGPVTFDAQLLEPGVDSRVRWLSRVHRRTDELDEWSRARLWGLLLANDLPVLAQL